MKVVFTGGFLGSGKTTAIINASQSLIRQHKKVAVITNDHGDQQVDAAFMKSQGISTREVSNGCFCCNYHQLDAQLESLQYEDYPDIIFAESVGTCTDLIATVIKPLAKQRTDIEMIISIFADANLLASLFEGHASFCDESIRYIYKKQLEEADLLIINKVDLLSPQQLSNVITIVESEYPGKIILTQNSLTEEGVSSWLKALDEFKTETRNSLTIDYDLYASGESKLAWLDKSITIISSHGDAIAAAAKIIGSIFDQIQSNHLIVGHLKFLVESENSSQKISFTTTSTSGDVNMKKQHANFVKMLINARIETNPETLERLVDGVLIKAEEMFKCSIANYKWAAFKPDYPKPIHRIDL